MNYEALAWALAVGLLWALWLYLIASRTKFNANSALLREVCAACGSIDATLCAVVGKPGVGRETLLIQYNCKVCGAHQYFAPLVVPEDGELKSFQRVGKVEGKAL